MPDARLLLTRPRRQSERFADEIGQRFGKGVTMILSPVLEILPLGGDLDLSDATGLVFTSENAVRVASGLAPARGMRAWCVGDRTARAAREAGFDATSAGGNVPALTQQILATGETGPLLHLRGAHVAGDLAGDLARGGVTLRTQVIYSQRAVPLSAEANQALASPGKLLIPVFSPRTAQLLREPLANARANLLIAAMSPAVAAELNVQSKDKVVVAQRSDSSAIVNALEYLLEA